MSEEEIIQPEGEVNNTKEETTKIGVNQAMEMLTSCHHEVTSCWEDYIRDEYNGTYPEDHDDMVDIITIVEYIVGRVKENQTVGFKEIFTTVEEVLENGSRDAKELIVVGLLEGLQNNCEMEEVDYHLVFDGWFGTKTKKAWDGLIYLLESKDSIEIKQQNLLNFSI